MSVGWLDPLFADTYSGRSPVPGVAHARVARSVRATAPSRLIAPPHGSETALPPPVAYKHQKLLRLPVIHKLKEAAPRSGFFERDAFLAVRSHLPDDLQVAVSIAYALGWSMQSEVFDARTASARPRSRDAAPRSRQDEE